MCVLFPLPLPNCQGWETPWGSYMSQKLKPGTKLRQTASLLGEPFCRQPTSFCPWEKLRAVPCMVFCACLHFVAGNQREGVGQRLSQADLKDEARLCYRSFCQAELSLSSTVFLFQPYKGIAPALGNFQGNLATFLSPRWWWYLNQPLNDI